MIVESVIECDRARSQSITSDRGPTKDHALQLALALFHVRFHPGQDVPHAGEELALEIGQVLESLVQHLFASRLYSKDLLETIVIVVPPNLPYRNNEFRLRNNEILEKWRDSLEK